MRRHPSRLPCAYAGNIAKSLAINADVDGVCCSPRHPWHAPADLTPDMRLDGSMQIIHMIVLYSAPPPSTSLQPSPRRTAQA